MKRFHVIAGALALALSTGAVAAHELKPVAAEAIDLGEVSGVAYYTVERDGFHVVATVASEGGEGRPVRLEAILAPGQSVTLSAPGALGDGPDVVEITRSNDRVLVRKTALVN